MTEKLVNFFLDEEKKKELSILAKREGRTIKEIYQEMTDNYIKVHQQGNPQHLISNFLENEDFLGFPSMGIDIENKKKYAENFLRKNPKLAQELHWHVKEWSNILEKI